MGIFEGLPLFITAVISTALCVAGIALMCPFWATRQSVVWGVNLLALGAGGLSGLALVQVFV